MPFKSEINITGSNNSVSLIQGGINNQININSADDIAQIFHNFLSIKEVQQNSDLSKLALEIILSVRNPKETKDSFFEKLSKLMGFTADSIAIKDALIKLGPLIPLIQAVAQNIFS